jgi:helix-turn-helix, Psq domain
MGQSNSIDQVKFSFSLSPIRMTRLNNVQSAEHNDRINDALEAYKSGNYKSYRAAARTFDMSKTTLIECAKGRTTCNLVHKDQQILSTEEEIELAQWITCLTLCGYPPKPYTIKEMAETIRTRRTLGINHLLVAFVNYNKIGEQ